MDYQVRQAEQEDLPRILSLYDSARSFMRARGNGGQWGSTNPPPEKILGDLERNELYVLFDDRGIHGVFMFSLRGEPTYGEIAGAWHSDRPYGVIHRVAGDGSGGIFRAAAADGAGFTDHLRVDTHEKNLPMQKAILREGFSLCGVIRLENGSERLAYDRVKSL